MARILIIQTDQDHGFRRVTLQMERNLKLVTVAREKSLH